jgi:hypothetical protein
MVLNLYKQEKNWEQSYTSINVCLDFIVNYNALIKICLIRIHI